MFDGLKRAMVLQGVRWAATLFGGSIALFAFSHTQIMAWVQQACALMSSQQAMEIGLPAFAVAIASLAFGVKDTKNVNGKMAVTAATAYDQGVAIGCGTQATSDTSKVAAVSAAMKAADTSAPATQAAVVNAIKSGTF